ncbi:O-antigen ligase family protein [Marinobacterium zhoushanense]|uniref:O-antigen ligase family protein n=1 Tax=Marinobacterium zhoushanense TaxID=1679163 RepID=UPI00166D93ED|nr:O-antigen ligase family protein [Marinobacterium zhoushanense]
MSIFSKQRLEQLATLSVYLVLGYVVNLMFFLPIGDQYLKPVIALALLFCLGHRSAISSWGVGPVKSLLLPMSLYSAVLVTSYLVGDGYMSTIRMFIYCSLFIYAASVVRLQPQYLAVLCILAAVEMLMLIGYRCGWEECSRFGGFTNPIFFGMYALSMSVLCTYLACAFANGWRRWLLYVSAVVFLAAAGLTQTRGVMLAMVPLLLIFAFYLYKHKAFSARRVVFTLVAATCLTGFVGFESGAYKRISKVEEELVPALSEGASGSAYDSSIGFRILMWKYALSVTMEHPVFGAGKERFQQYKEEWVEQGRFPDELIEYLPTSAHAHNQFFQELAMRGLIGFAALLALLAVPARKFVSMIRSRETEWPGYIGLSLVVAYATFSLTEVALKHPEKIAVFTVIGFIALSLGRSAPRPMGTAA